jgi:hypothetical protein
LSLNEEMRECVVACLHCYSVCIETARPENFRLMRNCAEICRTAADFMLSGSPLYPSVCEVCAQTCEACGMSCEDLGDMGACVAACRECAEACLKVVPRRKSVLSSAA